MCEMKAYENDEMIDEASWCFRACCLCWDSLQSFIFILNHYLNTSLIYFCIAKAMSSFSVTFVVWNPSVQQYKNYWERHDVYIKTSQNYPSLFFNFDHSLIRYFVNSVKFNLCVCLSVFALSDTVICLQFVFANDDL